MLAGRPGLGADGELERGIDGDTGRERAVGSVAEEVTGTPAAGAAGVSGRALPYAFRRHYGITPTGYLRRIRLERAHADLGGADPVGGTTVAGIARRWGWTSHSQFTVAYQKRSGVLPSRTLRG